MRVMGQKTIADSRKGNDVKVADCVSKNTITKQLINLASVVASAKQAFFILL